MTRKKRLIPAIYFLLICLVLGACSSIENNQANTLSNTSRNELILAIGGEPDAGFDPTTGWGRYGSPLFQSTLVKFDENFSVQNDLAKNFTVSDDGLEWAVEIRNDVQFSNGEDLTAEDVVFTFLTAKNSGSIIDLSNLANVEKIDTHIVKFHLKKPESTFVYLLATIGIVPIQAYDEKYKENPIGSGPYQIVQWSKGQQLIVEANPHYYGEKPYFEKLTFLFLSEDAAFAAAKAGQVDIVSVPPTFASQAINGMQVVEVKSVDNRGIMLPFLPTGEVTDEGYPIGNDVTSDIAIRKAINYAVDRQALVEGVLEGYGTPAYSVVDHLPWWNPDTVIEDNDIGKAEKILDEAGWKKNEQGIRENNGLQAVFTLIYPAGDQIRQSLSMAFAEMIAPLGIEVKTEGKSWNELGRLMYANPVMMGWGSHDPLEIYNVYSSKTIGHGFYNANYYSNSVVDDYMEKAMGASSQEEANTYWQKAQWDGKTGFSAKGDAPWVWLVNLNHVYFVRENLEIGEQRIQPHGHGWPITDFIERWHWKSVGEG